MDYKLVEIKKADDGKHKLTAVFYDLKTKKFKRVSFGAQGYKDYTLHDADIRDEKKRLYQARHKNDNISDPISKGSLSWHILWGKPTIKDSIQEFIKKFNL